MLDGSSRRRRSGSQKRARANARRIRQPPEKVLVANCCRSEENPRPARIDAARDSALSDSISASFAWISPRVWSRPSRSRSSFSASAEVSANDTRSSSIATSCLEIFCTPISKKLQNQEFWVVKAHNPCLKEECTYNLFGQ